INRRFQQFDGVTENFAETLPQSLQLKDLDFEHACSLFKVIHRNIIEPEDETGQDCSVKRRDRYEKIIRSSGNDIDRKCRLRPDIHGAGSSAQSPRPAKPPPAATCAGAWRSNPACCSRRQSAANVEP